MDWTVMKQTFAGPCTAFSLQLRQPVKTLFNVELNDISRTLDTSFTQADGTLMHAHTYYLITTHQFLSY